MSQKTNFRGTCAVFGLGKLGASFAAVLAAADVPVIGVDLDPRIVDAVNRAEGPFEEPGLAEVVSTTGTRLRATTDATEAALAADVILVIVPTPSDNRGRFMNTYVTRVLESVGKAIATSDRYHVVSITSTIMPGSLHGELMPTLARASGRTPGSDVGLCYNPTFVALGNVIHDLTHPDLVLIGESDARAGSLVEDMHRTICVTEPSVRHTTWSNAEIAKIAVNTYVTTKISFANMLSELCERTAGADVDTVTAIVGDDRRIGHAYLRGATAYGGPCFPRDNVALARAATDVGAEATLAEATDRVNRRQTDRLASLVERECAAGGIVAILGLAYKPQTNVIDESPGLALAARLIERGHRVMGFDPLVAPGDVPELPMLEITDAVEACVREADVVVIATAAPDFAVVGALARTRDPVLVVIDCWRLLAEPTPGIRVVRPGRGPHDEPSPWAPLRS